MKQWKNNNKNAHWCLILTSNWCHRQFAMPKVTFSETFRILCGGNPTWSIWQWASYQIRKIAGTHAPGMPGMFSPPPRVSDPDIHHGTCVTHVPWYMPGSLTSGFLWSRRRGKTFPAFSALRQQSFYSMSQGQHFGARPKSIGFTSIKLIIHSCELFSNHVSVVLKFYSMVEVRMLI